MKRFLSVIALLGLGSATMAQDIKVGPEIGATFNTMSQTISGVDYSTNYQLGFKIGGVVDYQFTEAFSIQPGLFLSINNGTESHNENFYKTGSGVPSSETDRRNYNITYLQLPVYALFKTGKEFDDPHFFIGVGPSFNMGIGGRYKREYIYTTNGIPRPTRYDDALDYGNNRLNDNLRRFDVSANATLGYELPVGLFFRAYYGVGLLNVAPGASYDNNFRNSGGGISVGFLFNATHNPRY